MMHRLLLPGMLAVLAIGLGTGRGYAQPGEKSATEMEAISKQLGELKKTVDELKSSDIAMNEKMRRTRKAIAELKVQIDDLQQDLAALSKSSARQGVDGQPKPIVRTSDFSPVGNELEEVKKQLDQLRQEMARSRGPVRANYPVTETGRIRLVNEFPNEVAVIVNGVSYHLVPGETRTLDSQPAGTFTYQVLGAQHELQPRQLKANETFTIRTTY